MSMKGVQSINTCQPASLRSLSKVDVFLIRLGMCLLLHIPHLRGCWVDIVLIGSRLVSDTFSTSRRRQLDPMYLIERHTFPPAIVNFLLPGM